MNYSLRLIKLKQVLRYAHQQDSRKYKTVWKTVLFVTPYIRVKRGCAGIYNANSPTTAWRAVHRQSGTAFQAD